MDEVTEDVDEVTVDADEVTVDADKVTVNDPDGVIKKDIKKTLKSFRTICLPSS